LPEWKFWTSKNNDDEEENRSGRTDLENLARIVNYVDNHFGAGHDLSDPKLVIDLRTLLTDLHRVLDSLGPPASTDQRVSFLVREVVKIRKDVNKILEILDIEASFD
jgi:hypothetical protein